MNDQIITQSYLHSLFEYDKETGFLTSKIATSKKPAGAAVGRYGRGGYIQLYVCGVKYDVHRLIWVMFNGDWPKHEIDHINGDTKDNRISNLRDVSRQKNLQNQKLYKSNKTGVNNTCWIKSRLKYRVRITVNKKAINLGHYDNFLDACCARKSAENKYGFHPNHGMR